MLIVGTRGSKLALAQTEIVVGLLRAVHPQLEITVRVIQSLGDQVADKPLEELAAQGIFTHALERALIDGDIDVAVHSAKDLPSTLGMGLILAAVPARADPRDCLVSSAGLSLSNLSANARVGTGSPRRSSQLLLQRPDLVIESIRGNVDTRRRAALDGTRDAVVLAMAGLARLSLLDQHATTLEPEVCLPQAGQGAIAVETLAARDDVIDLVGAIDDAVTRACVDAERATLAGIAAGCHAPVAAFAEPTSSAMIRLRALIVAEDGLVIRAESTSEMGDATQLGNRVAAILRANGAVEALHRRGPAEEL